MEGPGVGAWFLPSLSTLHPSPPPQSSHLFVEQNKKKQRKKERVSNQKLLKRLSPRSKYYYISHSREPRIQKCFLSANHDGWQYFSCSMAPPLWTLHFEIHFVGPANIYLKRGSFYYMGLFLYIPDIKSFHNSIKFTITFTTSGADSQRHENLTHSFWYD